MQDDALFRELPGSSDMQVPSAVDHPSKPRSIGVAFEAFLFLVIGAICLIEVIPKFSEVYRQVKVPMPGWTCLLMEMSDLACRHRWFVAIVVHLAALSLTRLKTPHERVARVLVPLLGIALLIWGIVALFLPLIGTLEGISHARH